MDTRNKGTVWRPTVTADFGADMEGCESGGLIATVCVALLVNPACLARQ